MEIKYTLLGLLVYAATLCWAAALAFYLSRRRAGEAFFALGFAAALGAVVLRAHEVGHAPLQNLFEVTLFLGMSIYPLSLFSRRFLAAGAPAVDVLVGLALLFPVGFVMSAEPKLLPPALQSWLFVPHVAVYMLAYSLLGMAGGRAVVRLFEGTAKEGAPDEGEAAVHRLVLFGFPLLALGLLLGAAWGRTAWGDWWHWDPKELPSLATFLVYVIYLHVRGLLGARYPRLNCAIAVVGAVLAILTLTWVNLGSRFAGGLHSYATM